MKAVKEQKQELFEQLVLGGLNEVDFKEQKAILDQEADHLQQLHDAVVAQLEQTQMDVQSKNVRNQLAQKVEDVGKLSMELVDALVDRVYVYPGNQLEIVWKVHDFAPAVSNLKNVEQIFVFGLTYGCRSLWG